MYDSRHATTLTSAERIVGELLNLFPDTSSVVDIGCGVGTFLSVFKEKGIKQVLGLDGSWVDPELLQISSDEFQELDLESPIQLNRKFDMAICLEVAEHISAAKAVDFVAYLCELSEVVIFSAAIPAQGGNGHVNEQWQTYWAEIFETFDMQTYDLIRQKIWNDESVLYWYRQNTLVFTRKKLVRESIQTTQNLDIVHPLCYQSKIPSKNSYLKNLILALIPNTRTHEIIHTMLKNIRFLKN
jgi:2-polyprenyl-3-methyl-5-hydroxy-6-metoxy-1,4-benzoquinol methylase